MQYLLNATGAIILIAMFIALWTLIHTTSASSSLRFIFPIFCLLFLYMLTINDAAIISLIHNKEKNTNTNLDSAYGWALRHFIPIAVINTLGAIVAFFTLPQFSPFNLFAMLLAIMLSQAYYFVLLENKKIIEALIGGRKITKGHRVKLLMLWIGACGYSPFILRYTIWRTLVDEQKEHL